MAAASELWPFVNDEKEHELILGKSFENRSREACAFHTIRYDFKPASVDSSKPAEVAVGEKDNITVTVPHVQDSGNTVYKGSKRPCPKEFLLVIDKKTQTFTLERIESTIPQLKKIRSAVPSKSNKVQSSGELATSSESTVKERKQMSVSPTEEPKPAIASSSKEPSPVQMTSAPEGEQEPSLIQMTSAPEGLQLEGSFPFSSSDSSSSDSEQEDANSDNSDINDEDDDEVEDIHVEQLNNFLSSSLDPGDLLSKKEPVFNQLCEDLELSESGSDSD